MPHKLSTGTCLVAVLALGLAGAASPAYAGFEWVAPDNGAAAPAPISSLNGYAPATTATHGPEVISPVIITGNGAPPVQPVPVPAAAPAYLSEPAIVATPAVIVAPSSMANATLTLPATGDTVQGFASQVPLALALRQILPMGTNFSIDQNIDMDTLVSYKGGKSWRDTMNDMLAPAGLVARMQGTTITVSRAGGGATAMPPLTATTMPVLPPATSSSVVVDNGTLGMAAGGHATAFDAPHITDMPSATNINPADGWSAQRGDTLRKVLTDWCHRSGVELQWLAEYDYPMEASAHFSGGFEDAVRMLLAGFETARPQPVGELHTNTSAGQTLLVVQTRGNNYSN